MPATRTSSREFQNDASELRGLSGWFRDFAGSLGVDPDRCLDLELCVNEIFMNIVSYAFEDRRVHRIRIDLESDGGELLVRFEDDGVPFNPLDAPDPHADETLASARIGGWGLPIVRALGGAVRYERRGNRNVLTLSSGRAPAP